jgi:flagellar basal-body rod protein FlgB
MEGISQILLLKALDGLSARAEATAQNIANAGTENYRPVRVQFEEALAHAASSGPEAVAAVVPRIDQAVAGDPLRLDLELATAAGTAGRYSALVEMLSRQIQIQSLAIKGTN